MHVWAFINEIYEYHFRYTITVKVSEQKPYTVRENTWCLSFPPRCSKYKVVYRTVYKEQVSYLICVYHLPIIYIYIYIYIYFLIYLRKDPRSRFAFLFAITRNIINSKKKTIENRWDYRWNGTNRSSNYAVLSGIGKTKARRGVLQRLHRDHKWQSLHSSLFRGLPPRDLHRAWHL